VYIQSSELLYNEWIDFADICDGLTPDKASGSA
jgi:hypothetical protein